MMYGSLSDFVEGVHTMQEQRTHRDASKLIDEEEYVPTRKLSIHERRRKNLSFGSRIDGYRAEDKSLLFQKFDKNFPQLRKSTKKVSEDTQIQFFTSRKPISQEKITSIFHGQSPLKSGEDAESSQLKREHALLRAIARAKQQSEQQTATSNYEQSFNRMLIGLKNIKTKPVIDDFLVATPHQKSKTSRSMSKDDKKINKNGLSNFVRLQFENCLTWSKKRNKNGMFYADKLGKNSKLNISKADTSNRKQILSTIRDRSFSLAQ